MKHIETISRAQSMPMPANMGLLGVRTLISLVNELVLMLSGVSGLIKGIPPADGGTGQGDGHDDGGGEGGHTD